MTAALYLRKSRADRTDETITETLQRHEETLRSLAQRQQLTIIAVYREVVSGDKLDGRAEMQRLLADCRATTPPPFQALLCMDIDRLGRGSMAEQGYILDTFKRAGIRLVTPRKVYDLQDDLDETYSEFESFIARQELKVIKRRLTRGVQHSAELGSFVSAPPYGYQRHIVDGHPSLQPLPQEAEAVRSIFRWYIEDHCGSQQIAERLNAMGYLPRRAAQFSRTTVLDILGNPVYAGRIVRRGITQVDCPGLHPALVAPEQFERAAAIRRQHAHPPAKPHSIQNPLAGLVCCGYCKSKMQRLPVSATRRQEMLACPRRGCNTASQIRLVEHAVWQAILPWLPPEIPQQTKPAAIAEIPPTLRKQQLLQQYQRLYSLLEQGIYSEDEFRRRRAALQQQLSALADAEPVIPAETLPGSTQDAYTTAAPAERNRLFKMLLRQVIYIKEPGSAPDHFTLEIDWQK